MKNTGEKYDWQAMVIITILMLVGFGIICLIWYATQKTNDFSIFPYGMGLIFSFYFINLGLYCWFMFINDVLLKPKKDILYLKKVEDNVYSFLDRKGKKYMFTNSKNNSYVLGEFYVVSKTRNVIKKIVDLSEESFIVPKEKVSYWLNWYSPIGNFENIYLLPNIYIMFIVGVLNFFTAPVYEKIFGFILMVGSGIMIIYDFVYKIKRSKIKKEIETINDVNSKNEELNNIDSASELVDLQSKTSIGLHLFSSVARALVSLVFVGICLWMFMKINNTFAKIFMIPFLICGLALLIQVIIRIINQFKGNESFLSMFITFEKIYVIGFLLFWFGILIFICYSVIKNGDYKALLFTIPFWIFGICVIYKTFKKR